MDNNLIGQTFHRDKLQHMLNRTDRAVVVVDGSGSRMGEKFESDCRDATTISGQLEARGTEVGVLQFSQDVRPHKGVDATPAQGALEEVRNNPLVMGSSGIGTAIRTAAAMLGRPGLILVFTDGWYECKSIQNEVSGLEKRGYQVVGVGRQSDDPRELGNVFNEHYRIADDYRQPWSRPARCESCSVFSVSPASMGA